MHHQDQGFRGLESWASIKRSVNLRLVKKCRPYRARALWLWNGCERVHRDGTKRSKGLRLQLWGIRSLCQLSIRKLVPLDK